MSEAQLQPMLSLAEPPQRILVVLPLRLESAVTASSLVRSISRRFPDAKITLLIHRRLTALLEGNPWVQDCRYWSPGDQSRVAKKQDRELFLQLRSRQFDLAVVLPKSSRAAWLCWRIGAARRVGFSGAGRSLLLTDALSLPARIGDNSGSPQLVDSYALLAAALGCESYEEQLSLTVTAECEAAVTQRLAGAVADGAYRPLVVLCPGAGIGASSRWYLERFAATADFLIRRRGATIAISVRPGEESLAEAIERAMHLPAVLLTQPILNLGELKSLIARCDLLLGNDAGPRHIARAFDVPAVSVFGPTDPARTQTSLAREVIVRVAVPCAPCDRPKCPLEEQVCMTGVTVEMVAEACERQLAAAHQRRQENSATQ